MRLWAWGQSDPGRKRERNEDSYLVDPETGIMAVADGMGGHQGGATASRMAVEYLGRELGEARGNFEKALIAQIQASVRVTEEMEAVDIPDSKFRIPDFSVFILKSGIWNLELSNAAAAPALAPNTKPSSREFDARRFAPWTPVQVTSPAA